MLLHSHNEMLLRKKKKAGLGGGTQEGTINTGNNMDESQGIMWTERSQS